VNFPNVEIHASIRGASLKINGERLLGVKELSLKINSQHVPEVTVTFFASTVNVELEDEGDLE
jgi:hypothetical protein